MKTQNKIGTLRLKHAFIAILLFALPFLSFGQRESTATNFSLDNSIENEEYQLYSFDIKYVQEKAYVNWLLVETNESCFYQLERSADNINFITIYVKKASKSPNNNKLMHSFIDNKPLAGTAYYRLRRLTSDSNTISEVVIVNDNLFDKDFNGVVSMVR